jgi:hypothetical protein
MAVGLPAKVSYVDGDVFSASDINDTNGTLNLVGQTNNFYAGKNKIINGDFGVWQRSTSATVTADSTYYAPDRFSSVYTAGGATVTWSRQTFTPGTAPVAGYEGTFFSRLSATSGGAGTEMGSRQLIENVRTFAGQTATFSFWAKADSARTASIFVNQFFGSGGSSAVTVNNSTFSVTTSWTRFSVTLTVPSITGKTVGTNSFLQALVYYTTGQASGTPQLDTWGWQLESGSTATAFQTATGTIQGELAACQRYYQRIVAADSNRYISNGFTRTSTQAWFLVPFTVEMRKKPEALEQTGTAADYAITRTTTATTLNAVPTYVSSFESGFLLEANVASGLTAGDAVVFRISTINAYIGWSAEL